MGGESDGSGEVCRGDSRRCSPEGGPEITFSELGLDPEKVWDLLKRGSSERET